jgi:hypothetical protein
MRTLTIVILGMLILTSCENEPLQPYTENPDPQPMPTPIECDPDSIYFVQNIQPLLNNSCNLAGCHNVQSGSGNVILADYESIMQSAIVTPFDASGSKIIEVVTSSDPLEMMPPVGFTPLTTQQKEVLTAWVNQGAKNNSCEGSTDTTTVSFSLSVWPIIDNECKSCHNGPLAGGGVQLTNYDEVYASTMNGDLINSILRNGLAAPMPPLQYEPLSQNQIDVILAWKNQGAPNN